MSDPDFQSRFFEENSDDKEKTLMSEMKPQDLYISRARLMMNDTINYEQRKQEQLKALGMERDDQKDGHLYENLDHDKVKSSNVSTKAARYDSVYPVEGTYRRLRSSRRGSQNHNSLDPMGRPESNDNQYTWISKRNASMPDVLEFDNHFLHPDSKNLDKIQERSDLILSESDLVPDRLNDNKLLRRQRRKLSLVQDKLNNIHNQHPSFETERDNFSSMQSKLLLPKFYSDDTDLFNPKPMTGDNQLNIERNYETFPLVIKKPARPSLQELEMSLSQKRVDDEDFLNEKEEFQLKANDKRTQKHESSTYTNKAVTRRRTNSKYKNVFAEDRIPDDKVDDNKLRERPNHLTLISSYQDLFKQFEQHQGSEHADKNVRNGKWSPSSPESYCSIDSQRADVWPGTLTPDSTSSSPIIWNFSHFYFEKK